MGQPQHDAVAVVPSRTRYKRFRRAVATIALFIAVFVNGYGTDQAYLRYLRDGA